MAITPDKVLTRLTVKPHEDLYQLDIQYNKLLTDVAGQVDAQSATGNVTVVTPTIGTTVTVAVPANVIQINGVRTLLTAETAKAFGSLGTIPASTWGIITLERVAANTTTFVSGAANYTTGYATEALALAAIPAISANKVRVGYLTVLASASTWVAGTDALAGGTGGNPATTTTYYPGTGLYTSAQVTAKYICDTAGNIIGTDIP